MSGDEQAAYRSSHPVVLDAWEKLHEESRAWSRALAGWSSELGCDGRFLVIGNRFAGFPAPDGDLPIGWRTQTRDGRSVLVPDKRTKAGKENAKRLAGVGRAPTTGDLPGMPDEIWVPKRARDWTHTVHPMTGVFLIDGAIWGVWGVSRDIVEKSKPSDRDADDFRSEYFEDELWENVRLSEYYAAAERHADEPKAVAS